MNIAPCRTCWAARFRVMRPMTHLYRCLDKLLAHKCAFFSFLRERWESLFGVRFDVLLSTSIGPAPILKVIRKHTDPAGKRQFGYSRDKRGDCVTGKGHCF